MSTYPMPVCGYDSNSAPENVHNLKTVRLGDNSIYGVVNGNRKKVWTLVHGACTWAEVLALEADYDAQVSGGSTTFNWYAGGATYSITGIWMRPPQAISISQYTYRVTSIIGQ